MFKRELLHRGPVGKRYYDRKFMREGNGNTKIQRGGQDGKLSVSLAEERRFEPGPRDQILCEERSRRRDTRKDKRKKATPEEYALFTDEERERYERKLQNFKDRSEAWKWKKGQSGNPGGRPKTPEGAKEAMKDAAFQAVMELIRIAGDKKHRKQLQAIEDLLDRVYGKPNQQIDADVENTVRVVMDGDIENLAK